MIDELRQKVSDGRMEYSLHAMRKMMERNITVEEVAQTLLAGKLIEDYPHDKYGPSCLILGRTQRNRSLHVQCTYPSRPLIKIITAYEPTTVEWDETLEGRK